MNFFNRLGRALLLLAAVVVGSVLMLGCGAAEKPSALVGQWVFAEGYSSSEVPEKSVEMLSDGTGVVDGMSITWKVENKRLVLLSAMVGLSCDYKVSSYELTLTYDNEKSATFVKKGKLEEYTKKREEEKKREAERMKKESEARFEKISTYFTDSRNGQKYRAVKIGGKTWMAQNFNYQTGNSWCYDGDNANCEKYGRLYDWKTATTVCPSGWHLPTRDEWNELVAVAGGNAAGRALKSAYGWNNDGNGADEFGFSALPGGYRDTGGGFYGAGGYGSWWTATEYGGGRAYGRDMYYDRDYVNGNNDGVSSGFSVRCFGD